MASLEGTRKRAERLLVEAISVMNDGFVLLDEDDRLVLCNERYRCLHPGLDEVGDLVGMSRSEERASELQSLMRISYAVFCLKNKKQLHSYIIDKLLLVPQLLH